MWPLDHLVNAQQQDLGKGKALADGGADTTIVGTGWTVTHKTQQEAHIKGFTDDLCKKNIPIVTAITVMDQDAVVIQANEALSLPDNLYTIFYSTQMREHGVEVNDKAKMNYGKQNLVVDGVELPLRL